MDVIEYLEKQISNKIEYKDKYNTIECPISSNKEFYSILDKIINREIDFKKILIYTDGNDSDGIHSNLIVTEVLKKYNIPYHNQLTSRKLGYGIKKETLINAIKEYDCDIIITGDVGITAKEELEYAVDELGIKYIFLTDHHEPQEHLLPDRDNIFIINNKLQANIDYHVCGAGLLYIILKKYYDSLAMQIYACIATVGDMVDINYSNFNRLLVKNGLILLNDKDVLKELKGSNSLLYLFLNTLIFNFEYKTITEQDFSFGVVPAINATSRLYEEYLVLDYFKGNVTITESKKILKRIKELNEIRKCKQAELEEYIINNIKDINKEKINIITLPNADKSLVGLVSSFVLNKYNIDNIVLCEYNGLYVGSGRSFNTDLTSFLKETSSILISGGGHKNSCGLALKKENIEKFIEFAYNRKEPNVNQPKTIYDIEYDVLMDDSFINVLDTLAPFGMKNPAPILRVKNISILDLKKIKTHIFAIGEIAETDTFESKIIELIFFKNYSNDIKNGKKLDYIEGIITNEKNFIVNSYKISSR